MSEPLPSPPPLLQAASRALLDTVGALLFAKDIEGRYVYINARFAELFGCSVEDVIGQDDSKLFLGSALADVLRDDRQVMDTGELIARYERLHMRARDSEHEFWTVKSPMFDAAGRVIGLCGVATDVTHARQCERAAEYGQRVLQTVLDHVDAHVYMKDRAGRFLFANRHVLELYGRSSEQLLGHTDFELLGAEQATALRGFDEAVFAEGSPLRRRETLLDPAGHPRHFWSTKLLLRREGEDDCLVGLSTDITEFDRMNVELQRSERRFRTLFEASHEPLVVLSEGRLVDCNAATQRLLDAPRAALLGRGAADFAPPLQPCGTRSDVKAAELIAQAGREGSLRFEWLAMRLSDRSELPVEVVLSAIDLDLQPLLLAAIRDLSAHKHQQARMEHLAFYDPLTDLPNRRLLEDRLAQWLAHAGRSGQYAALLYLDLDHFKPVNDQYGHAVGDQLLREMTRRLLLCVRASDTVSRQGGDEFVVLLGDLDRTAEAARRHAEAAAEKVRAALAQPVRLRLEQGEAVAECSASIGLLVFSADEAKPDSLLRRADAAMYMAKTAGGNQVRWAD
ncbi:MAG: diguanylate cyclase domain-containing protein [Lysobacterales bacterium]